MAARVSPVLANRIRTLTRLVGLAIALLAAILLAVSPFDRSLVYRLFVYFNPLSAWNLLAIGLSLRLSQSPGPLLRLGRALALLPLAYGIFCAVLNLLPGLLPGWFRPSLPTALTLILLALALAYLDRPSGQEPRPSELFAALALVWPYLSLLGYAFNLGPGHLQQSYRGMSYSMALIQILAAVGTLAARPERGLMGVFCSDSLGGSVLRRLAPAAFVAPLILGWLQLAGIRAGAFGPELGIALLTVAISAVGLGLILWNVKTLNRTEAERETFEAALKESEARYRLLADYSSDLLTLHSPEGTYLYASPASRRLLGYSPEELVGTSPVGLVVEADRHLIEATRQQLLKTPGPALIRYRIRRKDGSVVWLESTIQDVPADVPGEVQAMLVVSRDVTERVLAETALRESEDRYRRLVELSPEAIMVDLDGRLIFVNPAGAALIGARDASQLLGHSLLEFVHPDYLDSFREQMARARTERQTTLTFEKKMVRLDGSTVDVETTASPITYGGKEAVIAIIRNITERKRDLEEIAMRTAELQKATKLDRLKDHFLSTLSHEMKTPLSLIVGYSELLEDKYPDEPLLQGVQDGARRLTEHIDSMLDYSALLSGNLPIYRSEVDLGEIVETASHITHASREAGEHPLLLEIDPASPPVSADPRRLTQVLVELLDNAYKFTPTGGKVGIRVRPHADQVTIEVWDSGPGMTPEELEHIWEPFSQLAIGDTSRRGGLGLGLKIAKKLVELHGGTLTAHSELGQGSTFVVTLPASMPEGPSP